MAQPALEETVGPDGQRVAEFPLPRGKLVLSLQGHPPPWVEPVLRTLGRLLALPAGWDSYGSRAINPACAWAAWQLLSAVLHDDSPAPTVVPTARGGVQIEWHIHGIDLEIEAIAPNHYSVSFEDARTGETWDKEIVGDGRELTTWIAHLGPGASDGR